MQDKFTTRSIYLANALICKTQIQPAYGVVDRQVTFTFPDCPEVHAAVHDYENNAPLPAACWMQSESSSKPTTPYPPPTMHRSCFSSL